MRDLFCTANDTHMPASTLIKPIVAKVKSHITLVIPHPYYWGRRNSRQRFLDMVENRVLQASQLRSMRQSTQTHVYGSRAPYPLQSLLADVLWNRANSHEPGIGFVSSEGGTDYWFMQREKPAMHREIESPWCWKWGDCCYDTLFEGRGGAVRSFLFSSQRI